MKPVMFLLLLMTSCDAIRESPQIIAPVPTPVPTMTETEPGVRARMLEDRIIIEGERP